MKEKVAILFNPSSGQSRALKNKNLLEQKLKFYNVDYDLFISESEAHLIDLIETQAAKYKILAAAGGDSTYWHLVNTLLTEKLNNTAAMIGLGSSNDIMREFNLETIDKACAALKNQNTQLVDVGYLKTGGKTICYFPGQANIGLGAEVNHNVSEMIRKKNIFKKNQTLTGLWAIYSAFKHKRIPLPLNIKYDNIELNHDYNIALFSKIKYWATGKRFAPHSTADDGFLQAVFVKKCSFWQTLKISMMSTNGKHINHPLVNTVKSSEFTVSSKKPFMIQVDGEIIMKDQSPHLFTEIKIGALKKALNIVYLQG